MGMHRDQARKAAGRARIAAAGLAAVGGVVLFAPFPKLDAAPAGPTAGPVTPASGTGTPDPKAAPAFNPDAAAAVLTEHGPEPRPTAVAEATPPDGAPSSPQNPDDPAIDPPPTEVVAGAGPELRYLGPIVGPRRTLAMIALDGQQRVVAIGEEIDGKVVKNVAPTQIVLDDSSGVEHIITRAEQLLDWSMDAPAAAPTRGLGSKKLPGAAGKAGANAEHLELEASNDNEQKRAEVARRLAEMERGGATDDHSNNPNASPNPGTVQPRPATRPLPPGSPIPKTPAGIRGTTPGNTAPKYPPARPPVIPNNKGKTDEKKAGGNQA